MTKPTVDELLAILDRFNHGGYFASTQAAEDTNAICAALRERLVVERELEYALECSKNFGGAVNARVTELEQSLRELKEENERLGFAGGLVAHENDRLKQALATARAEALAEVVRLVDQAQYLRKRDSDRLIFAISDLRANH
jgi:hypothetical protein